MPDVFLPCLNKGDDGRVQAILPLPHPHESAPSPPPPPPPLSEPAK